MKDFESTLQNYYSSWNEGFKTKDDTHIRNFMSERFVGYWAFSGIEKPEEYFFDYDIVSVLNQYKEDTKKEFNVITKTERKNGENCLVFGTETSLIEGKPHQAKVMYVWGLENEEWKLQREYIEMEQ
ncbi:DUF4440 domain-containing protein [Ornithinibacillus bavariensis]|uniref:DUF4440 domain-containing protein n=1 Tax=Ornithinibacillus bavariensis TaxID=545502 RepID=A0A919X9G8_9BACI|nr:DUF4440 domain-containing protein [Ornithinibacillus bavariensis]GIO26600.1 hypothetical protein J43TS3_12110 [Ornithinibacillus bavariensis]